jgi:hypothetical protein
LPAASLEEEMKSGCHLKREQIIGGTLPASAYEHRQGKRLVHPHSQLWLDTQGTNYLNRTEKIVTSYAFANERKPTLIFSKLLQNL